MFVAMAWRHNWGGIVRIHNVFEVLQRISYRIRNDQRYLYYDRLKAHLALSRTEMVNLQNRLIQKIIHYAYFHTSYYRDLMQKNNLKPEDFCEKADLIKLPVLTKAIIRNNIDRIKSDDAYAKTLKLVTSGGSSGNQSHIFKSRYYEEMSRAFALRNNLLADWHPGDKSVWIWGSPIEHAQLKGSIYGRLGFALNRRIILNAYNYSCNDFPLWIKKIIKFKPKVIYGYGTILLHFSKYLLEKEIELPSIKTVISTAEALNGRKQIEKAFKCQVFNQYGSREILAIGIEVSKDRMMIADDAVALNIQKDGEFIITALHSYGFPLINYKLGDSGEIVENGKAMSGFPFLGLRLKIGRNTDNFMTRDHRIISSSALSTYISTFKIHLHEQQVVQKEINRFIVNFVPDNGFNLYEYKAVIEKVVQEYFGNGNKIQFNHMEKIPPEKSGKKLMFKRAFNLN